MQLDHIHVGGAYARLLIGLGCRGTGHVEAHHADHVPGLKAARRVGGDGLTGNQHVGAQPVLAREALGHHDRRGGATGGRAGHQAGHHAIPQHRRGHHILGGEHVAEHGQRVVGGVAARLGTDAGEGLEPGAVLLHMGLAGAGKLADGAGQVGAADQLVGELAGALGSAGAVGPDRLQRARAHLFKAHRQRAVDGAALHGLAREEECRRAGGAVVVDVHDRDPGHADVIQGLLAAGGIAVHVAGIGLLHLGVVQAGLGQRLPDRLGAHHVVMLAGAWLAERDHADAGNEDATCHVSFPS
ncbi:hypothetical protein D9M70_447090 [compost metagenome]